MEIIESVFNLKKHWGGNGNVSVNSEEDIVKILSVNGIRLPHDFLFFFKHINGTSDQDQEGFCFYGVENLIDMRRRFNLNENDPLGHVVIFADYMTESWWYGIKMDVNGDYRIGIISTSTNFKSISNSFGEFAEMYLIDSHILYEC